MTKIKSEIYTCPKCGKESSFVMYESVNVDLDLKSADNFSSVRFSPCL